MSLQCNTINDLFKSDETLFSMSKLSKSGISQRAETIAKSIHAISGGECKFTIDNMVLHFRKF